MLSTDSEPPPMHLKKRRGKKVIFEKIHDFASWTTAGEREPPNGVQIQI